MKRIVVVISLIIISFVCPFFALAEHIGDTEIHRANGWIEKYYNYPDEVIILKPGEEVVFTTSMYSWVGGINEKIDLKKDNYQKTSAWITIMVEDFSDVQGLTTTMNKKPSVKTIEFLGVDFEGKEEKRISFLFSIDQKDIDSEKYSVVIKTGKNIAKFFLRDASNIPMINMTWFEYHSSIKKYRVR